MDNILKFPRLNVTIENTSIEEMMERMEYIASLGDTGDYDGKCNYCVRMFLPELMKGKKFYDIMAPRHNPKPTCQSGMQNHCTCDICF